MKKFCLYSQLEQDFYNASKQLACNKDLTPEMRKYYEKQIEQARISLENPLNDIQNTNPLVIKIKVRYLNITT